MALAILGPGVVLLIWAIVASDVLRPSIYIEDLSVPTVLSDRGFTPSVAAEHLKDALSNLVTTAETPWMPQGQGATATMRAIDVALKDEQPQIEVPSVNLSADTIASAVSRFFRFDRRRIVTGEIVAYPGKLVLTVRVDGQRIPEITSPVTEPDKLLPNAAKDIMEIVDPIVLANVDAQKSATAALKDTQLIIARFPPSDPNVIGARELRGDIFLGRNKNNIAIDNYRRAAQYDAHSAYPYNGIGAAYEDLGNVQSAFDAYEAGINANSRDPYIHTDLGLLLEKEGRQDEAMAEYNTAAELNKSYSAPHVYLAIDYKARHELKAAVEELRTAISCYADNYTAHVALGNILLAQKQSGEAESEYRYALSSSLRGANDDSKREAFYMLGTIYFMRHKIRDAERELRSALSVDPNYGIAHTLLGKVLEREQRENEAKQEYVSAVSADEKLIEPHVLLGDFDVRHGDFKAARDEYVEAAKLGSKNATLKLATLTYRQ